MKSSQRTNIAINLIREERNRQIREEHFSEEHDAEWTQGELAIAAACYATAAAEVVPFRHIEAANGHTFVDLWPWGDLWDRRKYMANYVNALPDRTIDRMRFLEKAGALIVAELERLGRMLEDEG